MFKKISALHAKNAFSFAILTGNLFRKPEDATAEDEKNITALIDGEIDVPLPVYFTLGTSALPDPIVKRLESNAEEVCPNLYFLGKRASTKTSEGISIVSLGGSLDLNIIGPSEDKYPPFYNEEDVNPLKQSKSADLLITSQWPSNIRTGSKVNFDGPNTVENSCIADLCSALRPKYHFSTGPSTFYEREPFFHPETENVSDAYSITRFISLADFGNQQKAKWMYAFTLDPQAAPPVAIPTGTTPSPLYFNPKKRVATEPAPHLRSNHADRYPSPHSHGWTDRYRPKRSRRTARAPMSECYFCIANPNIATHLIASLGEEAYMTIAKGPLSTADTFPGLGCPTHMLIIPTAHVPMLSTLDIDQRKLVHQEMRKFQVALNNMLSNAGAGSLGSVTWEVSRSGGVHTHWQYLPVPADLVRKGLVDAAFKVEAANQKYQAFRETNSTAGLLDAPDDSFRVTIWAPRQHVSHAAGKQPVNGSSAISEKNGSGDDVQMEENGDGGNDEGGAGNVEGEEMHFYMPVNEAYHFDLQFGRSVMVKLLGLEDRKHWQDCTQSTEDELRNVKAFKELFDPYDFTREEVNPEIEASTAEGN